MIAWMVEKENYHRGRRERRGGEREIAAKERKEHKGRGALWRTN